MEATALRALNSAFVRQGIVADEHEPCALPPDVLSLLNLLQRECRDVCENPRDSVSAVQLWKERSLHQTLEALDSAATGASSASTTASETHEKQIAAIETHEKSGRAMNDTLQRHRLATARDMHARIDAFASKLATVLAALIRPEVDAELAREQAVVCRLVTEKQQLDHALAALETTNQQLMVRVGALENAPDGGGDAVLCNKLRERVRALSASNSELRGRVERLTTEQEKHRYAMAQMKDALEAQQRTFLVTKAMHEKETKQLVALVQTRQVQFTHVMQQTQVASSVYDPVSGHTTQFASQSPTRNGRTRSSSSGASVFATASPPQSPKRALERSMPSPRSQGRTHERDTRAYDSTVDGRERHDECANSDSLSTPCSPVGQVRRLGSSSQTSQRSS